MSLSCMQVSEPTSTAVPSATKVRRSLGLGVEQTGLGHAMCTALGACDRQSSAVSMFQVAGMRVPLDMSVLVCCS